ncbi:MAG: alpha/beta hydrolase [Pseudonocardia sp.]|nr:alpha/beta hydrolase [Pseudonocardia sp.]
MRARRSLLAVATVAVVAMTVACTTTAGAPTAAADPTDPALARFYDQKLSWGSCATFAITASDEQRYAQGRFGCSRLEVPLDYAEPGGPTAQIAVLRQQATGQDRIGSLLFNPGGPGASGNRQVVYTAPDLDQSPLSRRFDLVGFDPRGTGASVPALDCIDAEQWAAERLDLDIDPSPAGVAQTEQENKAYVQGCIGRSGGTEVLANMGTRDAARDMDVLRAALGDDKLTYIGYSAGTRLGSIYAELFPRNVRALVLDGALDPNQSTIDRIVKQNAGFQQAFETYAADCATNPSCPLGTDPAQATARLQALTRPLVEAPLAVGARRMSYNDALTGVVQALYSKDLWPVLTRALSAYATGDGRLLLRLADFYYGRETNGEYSNFIEAFRAISCLDEERTTRAEQGELSRAAKAAAPFQDDGQPPVAALDICGFWPSPPTSTPHVPSVPGLPPVVVVSTTGDPATPYQAGVDLAAGLGASLITFESTEHGVTLQGNRCLDDAVTAYLVDLVLPPAGLRCSSS